MRYVSCQTKKNKEWYFLKGREREEEIEDMTEESFFKAERG
jgi:uncharacterized protein YdaT